MKAESLAPTNLSFLRNFGDFSYFLYRHTARIIFEKFSLRFRAISHNNNYEKLPISLLCDFKDMASFLLDLPIHAYYVFFICPG